MSEEKIKDIIEIIELSKEEIENNEDITATLDLEDLKSLKCLLDLYNKEKEKNKELEEELKEEKDLTTIYLNGFYDGEQKWKDKIREIFDNYSQSSLMENNTFLEFKKELLEE